MLSLCYFPPVSKIGTFPKKISVLQWSYIRTNHIHAMRNFSLLSLYKQTNRCFSTLCVPTQADFYLGIFPRRTEQSVHPPTWFGGAEGKDKLSLFPLSPLSTTYLMARTTRTFNETNPNLLNLQLAPARNSHSHANLVKNGTHTQQPNQTDKID